MTVHPALAPATPASRTRRILIFVVLSTVLVMHGLGSGHGAMASPMGSGMSAMKSLAAAAQKSPGLSHTGAAVAATDDNHHASSFAMTLRDRGKRAGALAGVRTVAEGMCLAVLAIGALLLVRSTRRRFAASSGTRTQPKPGRAWSEHLHQPPQEPSLVALCVWRT